MKNFVVYDHKFIQLLTFINHTLKMGLFEYLSPMTDDLQMKPV